MKFGDYSRLTADGLIYSSGKRRARNGTFRFWSPEAYYPYYIYCSVSSPGKSTVRKVTAKSDLAQECTWTEAITIILDAHARHRQKVKALLKKEPRLRAGQLISNIELTYDSLYEIDESHRLKIFKEFADYVELIHKKMPNLVIMNAYSYDIRDMKELRRWILLGDETGVSLSGPQRLAALNFLKATFPRAEHFTQYLHPGQESHKATWRSTTAEPSTWEKKEP